MFTVQEIYDIAITLEKNGIKFYEEALKRVADERVLELLTFLLEEERGHLETFTRYKEEHLLKGTKSQKAPPGMEDFLKNVMAGRMLSWEDRPSIEEGTSFKDIKEAAIEFETDGLIFFEFMRDMLDSDEDLTEMDRIIGEERKHVERLNNLTV